VDNPNGSRIEKAVGEAGITPVSTEVLQKPERRTFTAEYKLHILREADQCRNGEMGALLRREGLYSSHLTTWRKERDSGRMSVESKKRGRKPNPLEVEVIHLRKQLQRTEKRLEQANAILEAQKKLFDIFGVTATGENIEANSDPSSRS
jgi:transposase